MTRIRYFDGFSKQVAPGEYADARAEVGPGTLFLESRLYLPRPFPIAGHQGTHSPSCLP